MITNNSKCLAIAGTHGKTTTTAILTHLMFECDQKFTSFIGGISENYNSNFIDNGHEYTIVEADEYDRSFLCLAPDIACITSIDADHLDIYGDESNLNNAFSDFSKSFHQKINYLFILILIFQELVTELIHLQIIVLKIYQLKMEYIILI